MAFVYKNLTILQLCST